MYNRYIPNGSSYTRVAVEEEPERRETARSRPAGPGPERGAVGDRSGAQGHTAPGANSGRQSRGRGPAQELLDGLAAPLRFLGMEDKGAGMAGILKALNLEELDSGDILLLLIMLFLFLEGDNLELVITLGLMLLLSLGDEKKESQGE